MCFNIGVIIGPILGGILADPAGTYPKVFGHIEFFKKFPYAAPNIVSAFFLFSATAGVFFGLAEVWSTDIILRNSFFLTVDRHSGLSGIMKISE